MASEWFSSNEPRRDSTVQLLLLISRAEIEPALAERVRSTASNVTDWQEFVDIAERKFVAPYAYLHLSKHAPEIVPANALEALRQIARLSSMAVLRLASAYSKFYTECIAPISVQHAFIKGLALEAQYGQPIGMRICRDVDVLVCEKDFRKVVFRAIDTGYKVVLGFKPFEYVRSQNDLDFLLTYTEVITLISPDNAVIEVHRRLDKTGLDFDIRKALAQAEPVQIGNISVLTLPASLHFVYVCYHHSRHMWSRLHWLADIDMMARSPLHDRADVARISESVGIRPTIEAALDMLALSIQAELPDLSTRQLRGGEQFLKACLLNLEGDLELEYELRRGRTMPDFMSAWQVSPGRYSGLFVRSLMARFRPALSQYRGSRYPKQLFWLYTLQRAFAHMLNRNRRDELSVGD